MIGLYVPLYKRRPYQMKKYEASGGFGEMLYFILFFFIILSFYFLFFIYFFFFNFKILNSYMRSRCFKHHKDTLEIKNRDSIIFQISPCMFIFNELLHNS